MTTITAYARGYDDGFQHATAEYKHRNATSLRAAIDTIATMTGDTYAAGRNNGFVYALEELLFTLEAP